MRLFALFALYGEKIIHSIDIYAKVPNLVPSGPTKCELCIEGQKHM